MVGRTIGRVRIVFARGAQGQSIATIYRNDGVVVELPSYSRTHRVPHDLAHAVAEREFGLADGIFGSIAAGAMFDNMRVVAGRPATTLPRAANASWPPTSRR